MLRKQIEDSDNESNEDEDQAYQRGYESEEDDLIEEPHGIKGMTL